MLHRNAILEESKKRDLYAIPDVSHIFDDGVEQMVYGECYLLRDGELRRMCESGEFVKIINDIEVNLNS